MTKSCLVKVPPSSRLFGNRARDVAQTFVKRTPLWDVDLGAVQQIAQIRLQPEAGKTICDVWVMVSDVPFVSDNLEQALKTPGIWRMHITQMSGPIEDVVVDDGTTGRFLRIQRVAHAPDLPLEEIDIYLPEQAAATPQDLPCAKLTARRAGLTVAAPVSGPAKGRKPRPARDGIFQDVLTKAGQTYVLTFLLEGPAAMAPAHQLHAWWNGQLLPATDFRANTGDTAMRVMIEVAGSGGMDRLMFREGASVGFIPDSVSLKPLVQGRCGLSGNLIDASRFKPISLARRSDSKHPVAAPDNPNRMRRRSTAKSGGEALPRGQILRLRHLAETLCQGRAGLAPNRNDQIDNACNLAWVQSYLGMAADDVVDEIVFK